MRIAITVPSVDVVVEDDTGNIVFNLSHRGYNLTTDVDGLVQACIILTGKIKEHIACSDSLTST